MERAARAAQIIMGAVFLVSGVHKIWEPILFYWEIVPYTQMLGIQQHWPLFSRMGLLVAPFECALAAALLANWRPRWTMPVAALLMGFFLALVVQAWRVGATDECGCFGTLVNRSPGEAAVEDAVMLVLLLFGWWGVVRRASWRWGGQFVLGAAILALVVGAARFVPDAERLQRSDLLPGVRLTGLEITGLDSDLRRGEYLVELFSPRCGRCLQSVPKLNAFVRSEGLPAVVALASFPRDGDAMREFVARSGLQYPIGTISRTDFFRLTWGHGYPRLAYISNGVVRHVWEHSEFPTEEALRAVIAAG